jgi:hypothetical protein
MGGMSFMKINDFVIKPVAFKIYDVFWGNGWDNWSRFEIKYFDGKMKLNLIKGKSMNKELFSKLYIELKGKKADHGSE